jgi:hypothetical protein
MNDDNPKPMTTYQQNLKKGLEALGFTNVNTQGGVSGEYNGKRYGGMGCSTAEKAGDLIGRLGKTLG